MGNLKDKLEAIRDKLGVIKADYNESIDLCDTLMGVGYKAEAKKIAEQFSTMTYEKGKTGIPLNKPYKMSINPELHPTITEAEALEIRQLWNNDLAAIKLENHGNGFGGGQFGIADGGIWFSILDGMAHVSLTWKENWNRDGFDDNPLLAEPYWKVEQSFSESIPDGKVTTQEVLTAICDSFYNEIKEINEVYVCKKWGISYSADSLSAADIENMTKLLNYLVKFTGATFTEVSE